MYRLTPRGTRGAYTADRSAIVELIFDRFRYEASNSLSGVFSALAVCPVIDTFLSVATAQPDRALPLRRAINPRGRFNLAAWSCYLLLLVLDKSVPSRATVHFIGSYLATIIEPVN